MKPILSFLALFALGALIVFGGVQVFGMPHESHVAIFRVVFIGFIPIPIPIALFTSPHFWGGLICLLGLGVAGAAFAQFKK